MKIFGAPFRRRFHTLWLKNLDTNGPDKKHVWGMDTVNRYSQSGCFKTCFGHGYGCVRKNWGTVPRSTIAFPFDDHLGPRPIFRETTIHTDDILIYPFSIRNKFTYYLSIILYMERYDYQ